MSGHCLYCGEACAGLWTCRYCRDLLGLDPYHAELDADEPDTPVKGLGSPDGRKAAR